MHRSDVLGGLSRAEVDSEHRLRGLALEGVRRPGKSPAQTHLNARHGPQEPNNRARAAQDDGAAEAQKLNSCFPREDLNDTPVVNQPQGYQKPCAAAVSYRSSSETNGGWYRCSRRENETPRICTLVY